MNIVATSGKFTVRASEYLRQDSSIWAGGGTDETEVLQAILDKAVEWGGLVLEVDGVILTRGFKIYSNTTIHCANQNCGFYLADGSNQPLVQNAHLDFEQIHEENIALIGGTYHLNCEHQERTDGSGITGKEGFAFHTTHGMLFYGVRTLTIRDVRTVDQRIFTALFANWEQVVVENMTIDLPHNYYAQNQDGLHFWGPGRGLSIRNIQGSAGDDFIALAPDEFDYKSDITDVVIDGVHLEEADQGIRIMSHGPGRLDRVIIRNVYGTYKSCGFFLNPYFKPGTVPCEGNYGSIYIENVQLQPTYHKYEAIARAFLFRIGGRIQSLTIKDVKSIEPNDDRPLIEVSGYFGGYGSPDGLVEIANLTVDGLEVLNRKGCTKPAEYVSIDGGKVDHLTVRNVLINRDGNPSPEAVVLLKERAEVKTLTMTQVEAFGIDDALRCEGKKPNTVRYCEVYVNNEEKKT